jgi:hypothetical protein
VKSLKLPKHADPEIAKARRWDLVHVRWRDSSRINLGWDAPAEYIAAMHRQRERLEETAGFFIQAGDAYVLIALNVNAKIPSMTDAMVIPHEAIRSFEIVRPRKAKG